MKIKRLITFSPDWRLRIVIASLFQILSEIPLLPPLLHLGAKIINSGFQDLVLLFVVCWIELRGSEVRVEREREMAVELHLVPQFRVPMPRIVRNGKAHVNFRRPSIPFRSQPPDGAGDGLLRRHFDGFIAHEAVLDEQYWAAAWLRAEAHWESLSYMRHVNTYKTKYAEQEFYALKRRCSGQDGNSLKCFCVVALAVEREEGNNGTALNSVVGTLDVSIRQFFHGEKYPAEIYRPKTVLARQDPLGAHKYAYIANVCVSTFARRQGVATNMIYLGTDLVTSAGIKILYVHVNADNEAAQSLYLKSGFKVIHAVSTPLTNEPRLLMSMEL